jgi:hypothetical protein
MIWAFEDSMALRIRIGVLAFGKVAEIRNLHLWEYMSINVF